MTTMEESRVAFVTVGATAGFRPLLREVLSERFIARLLELGYTRLVIQCGPDSDFLEANFPRDDEGDGDGDEVLGREKGQVQEKEKREGGQQQQQQQQQQEARELLLPPRRERERRRAFVQRIAVFAYTSEMAKWMRLAGPGTDEDGGRRGPGVVISHAGSGSIMDALGANARLVAVPNPALMDNHQEELAEEMERRGYLVWGKLGSLADAVQHVEEHVPKKWPPEAPSDSRYRGGLFDSIISLLPKDE